MAKKKKALVIVESPAKAKKIQGFLGDQYVVRASVGHVRDLPARAAEIPAALKKESWSNLGVNVDSEFEPLYVVPQDKKKTVKELKDLLKDAEELLIATDEDREGESIGWHLIQLLNPKVPTKRMVFSEITNEAILEALSNTREMDENLVAAQETRRVVDRLYGYTLSPLLWKKIAPKLSAGRVQSVAVRILVEREIERLKFRSGSFWDLKASLKAKSGQLFDSVLQTVGGQRIATGKDFDENTGQLKEGSNVLLLEEDAAKELQARIASGDWVVTSVEQKRQTRKPAPPFTTSTLQQEASRKLNMTARQTMQTAQRLYEAGHITYMRTDSVNLSAEAMDAARGRIDKLYGGDYLSPSPRQFTNKNKGAQEAHEAIRPAGKKMMTAEEIGVDGPQSRLYDLIWKRTMATQMADAKLRFDNVTITAGDADFRSSGRTVEFPGFFRAYVEGSDDPDAALDDQDSPLPPLAENDKVGCEDVEAIPHETKPPARYTEASLVRKLEAEGIGRPSTYASIIGTIQDREYVNKNGSQLVPTFKGLAVTKLLEKHFPKLVDFGFTAGMEQTLDDIATGNADRLPYLREFYAGDEGINEQVKKHESEIDPREACTLKLDGIDADVRVGRYGPYFEKMDGEEKLTASIPLSVAPADLNNELAERLIEEKQKGPTALGMHPEEGQPVYQLNGPFGPYLQLGEVTEEQPKPKRCSIPNCFDPLNIDLETAIQLLALPRRIGKHPLTDKVVNTGIGRFGPYVLHNKVYGSYDRKTHTYEYNGETYNVLNMTMDAAVELLKNTKKRAAPEPIREIGKHPEDESVIGVFEGRYGMYVKHGKINATIPKDTDINSITLEQALEWIDEKAAKKGIKKKSAKKKAAKKKTAKKKAAKKAASGKKKTAKKKSGGES
ncbi:DNA topoisomerase 1 [Fuerstiella marisgermanici]|uniref:DNA topoisomerase 1 n=1 Tax=Fuerstiella marisgermanici TaxID=1891926 RepID=A0A1P8WMP0_9PLAN|nr:type I DNA topoisomerase [Fuerstiella marisgermanici]APZ95330.1 DNA topoisomerase 1 [Fuerstiella marisgermanici]